MRDALLPALLAVLCVVELAGLQPHLWEYALLLEVVGCLCLVFRRRLTVVAPVAAIASAFSPMFIDRELSEPSMPVALAIMAVYSLARWNPVRPGLIGMGAVVVQVALMYLLGSPNGDTGGFDISDVVFVGCLLTPPYILGRLTRRLSEQAAQLEQQQEIIKRAAVHDERDRIARDLHDVIAHSVSAMVVQTAAAQEIVRTDPAKAEALLENVAGTGRQALAETGRLLHVIRDDKDELGLSPAPGLARLDELVETFRSSGLTIAVHRDNDLPILSGGADVSAYRVVQEALTNALKYAPDHAVTLELAVDGDMLRIHTNNWSGAGSDRGSGLGLMGMQERLDVVGGELSYGVTPAGKFEMTATVPVSVGAVT